MNKYGLTEGWGRFQVVLAALKVSEFGSDLEIHAPEQGDKLTAALAQFRSMATNSTVEDGPDIGLVVAALRATGFGPEKPTDWVTSEVLVAINNFEAFAVDGQFYRPASKPTVYKGGEDELPQTPSLPGVNEAPPC